MKKLYKVFIFCLLVHLSNNLLGQQNYKTKSVSNALKEQVYIHYNSNLLFVGEYAHYTMYCTYLKNQKPSEISKIGYVDLIGEGNKVVVTQKVFLKNGIGRGDFFIPTSVASGNYKIIGYTSWMKNNKVSAFFSGDIIIINPYQENQNINFVSKTNMPSNTVKFIGENLNKGDLNIEFSKNAYNKRAKVTLQLFPEQKHINGTYSLSVHKTNAIVLNSQEYSNNYNSFKDEINPYVLLKEEKDITLPELRGEIIEGNIQSISDSIPINNISVCISIPSKKGYFFKNSKTNNLGEFKFIIDKEYDTSKAIIQVFNKNKENYTININNPKPVNLSSLTYKNPSIPFSANKEIKKRSIHNQIENAYFELKPDSILVKDKILQFTTENKLTYQLDDYTRFKTVKETLVEIVNNVWSKKIGDDKYIFQVRMVNSNNDYFDYSNIKALVIVDGIMVQDHTILMNYDARNIDTISIVRNKYVYGEEIYEGIIEINTKKGDFKLPYSSLGILNYSLSPPTKHLIYYKPDYDNLENKKNIPDLRYQLLWQPYISFDTKNIKKIEFYTSDITGEFKATLRGFTNEGEDVFFEKYFTVN
ncbi:hypothetical protein [Cellulophaga omnivescoria]|uniref:hypothetical protein n=1 Tax=Cellulophaga omnivescoria TaxID=1888890 RepID=UPI0009852D96|nr:hypothetical protein [Cellulophaga omnivescoria]WBU88925.1 hypothetical protein PBN93_13750 [Cellulophaga omnivescoria]